MTKGVPFELSEECQTTFNIVKKHLTSAPVLTYPCPGEVFILDTDASSTGLGAVLSQVQYGEERVLGYFSRSLSRAEKNYCVTRKELLALIAANEHFNYFLYGQKFVIQTDHSALEWLICHSKMYNVNCHAGYKSYSNYDFDVVHHAGKNHQIADALSRHPCLLSGCRFFQKLNNQNAAYLATT